MARQRSRVYRKAQGTTKYKTLCIYNRVTKITFLATILGFGILLIIIPKLTKKQIELVNSFNSMNRNRLLSYLLFVVTSFILPFIVTIFTIIITDSRENGMQFGFRIPFFVIIFCFAFVILKSKITIKILAGLIVTVVTMGLMWFIIHTGILESGIFENFDSYGIWRLIGVFIVLSLTLWEMTYRIVDKK